MIEKRYDFSRWKLLRMSWHVMFPYRPRWLTSIYILLYFIPSFFLLTLFEELDILRVESENTVLLLLLIPVLLCAILVKVIIYHKYLADLIFCSVYSCCGTVKEIDRYEHWEYMRLTFLNNDKHQQYFVYGPLRNLFPNGLKQKEFHFFYLERSKIIVSRPELNSDRNQTRDLPDSPLLANQIYAGLLDNTRTEYVKIISRFLYQGPVKHLFLIFPAIIWLSIIQVWSIKIALLSIPFLTVVHLIFMKFIIRNHAKEVLIGLECGKVYALGEPVPEDKYGDKIPITTDHGTIDCSYLKEEMKLSGQLQAMRRKQRYALTETVIGTVYYVVYYKHGGDEGDFENPYSTVYILLDIR